MANEINDVRMALARAVADHKISDDVIDDVAKRIATAKHPIRGIDVCERGICIDYFIDNNDWQQKIPSLVELEGGRLRGIEIFPWGIINPDLLQIRVTQEFDAMPRFRR
jgi:hypothetical protein